MCNKCINDTAQREREFIEKTGIGELLEDGLTAISTNRDNRIVTRLSFTETHRSEVGYLPR